MTLLNKRFWSVLTVDEVLIRQAIGTYSHNSIIEMYRRLNIADTTVDQITPLSRSERRALTRTVNGRYNNG